MSRRRSPVEKPIPEARRARLVAEAGPAEVGPAVSRQAVAPQSGHLPNLDGRRSQRPLQSVLESAVNDALRGDRLTGP